MHCTHKLSKAHEEPICRNCGAKLRGGSDLRRVGPMNNTKDTLLKICDLVTGQHLTPSECEKVIQYFARCQRMNANEAAFDRDFVNEYFRVNPPLRALRQG